MCKNGFGNNPHENHELWITPQRCNLTCVRKLRLTRNHGRRERPVGVGSGVGGSSVAGNPAKHTDRGRPLRIQVCVADGQGLTGRACSSALQHVLEPPWHL